MKEIAQFGSLIIYSLSIVFHLLVLIKIIPYKMVWGGRLKSDIDMYKFEAVSLTVNLLFLFILLVQYTVLELYLYLILHASIKHFFIHEKTCQKTVRNKKRNKVQ